MNKKKLQPVESDFQIISLGLSDKAKESVSSRHISALTDLDHVKIERETTRIFKLLNLSLSTLNYLRNQGEKNKESLRQILTFILSVWYRVVNGRETSQIFKLIRTDLSPLNYFIKGKVTYLLDIYIFKIICIILSLN